MRIYLTSILIILCALKMTAQTYTDVTSQYIINPSFEEFTACPQSNSVFPQDMWIDSVVGWYSPTSATSDYLNSCNTTDNGVPYNYNTTYQPAFQGDGYCGFLAYSVFNERMWCEYIGTKLIQPLTKDKYYRVAMKINRANEYNLSVSQIGIHFSDTCFCKNNVASFNIQPTVINNSGFLNDTINWMTVEGIFKAKGNEDYITIGWFGDTITSDYYFLVPPVIEFGDSLYLTETYYLVDYLTLEEVDYNFTIFNINVITPNNDKINDVIDFKLFPFETMQFSVFNRWGNLIFYSEDVNTVWGGLNLEGKQVSDGTYFYVIQAKLIGGGVINEQHSITIINN